MQCRPILFVLLCISSAAAKDPPTQTTDQALKSAAEFLVKQQSPDGWWRSEVYATFKDGKALTPLAVVTLQAADLAPEARKKGAALLAKMARPDGSIDEGEDGIDYPAYTASLAVIALSHPENKEHAKARDAWVKYLLDRQLTETLGWKSEDKQYGGWGYCRVLPRKPEPNSFAPPLIESNLSATVFALEALRAAGYKNEKILAKAHVFVKRCQNPDGGFHFIYDDPIRNKGGAVPDQPGQFHSYGSTTADGWRALRLSILPVDDVAEIARAREWMRKHFRADSHPGVYIPTHERNRDAVYFYYAASAAKAFRQSPGTVETWADTLAAELRRRQRSDGSWANSVELVRENDPIVATCQAMIALAECRAAGAK